MAWAVALNPNNEGNQYISSIDINSQLGNPNPVWNLKFKLSAGNEVSGFYRIAAESIGNVASNRILLAADLSEIRFYRNTTPKTFSLSGASVDDIFEFDSDGTQLECLVNGVSQGFIAGATGVTLLNFGANLGNYSNMELEYVNYTTTDDSNLNRNYDATGSDHNSLILSDITGNDTDGGSFNNMTTANWINLGGDASGAGESIGTSTATAIGASINSASGTSIGTSTASAVSQVEQIISGVGESNGLSSAIGVGSSTSSASGESIGASSAQGFSSATAIVPGVGESIGESSALASGKAFISSVGESNGASSALATGKSIFSAVGSSDGISIVSGSGSSLSSAVGESVGGSSAIAFSNGEIEIIVGLTLELSSDIITLELSSEQDIRELA